MNDYRSEAKELLKYYGIRPSSTARADEAVRRYRQHWGSDEPISVFVDTYIEHPADQVARRLYRHHIARSTYYKYLMRAEERIGMILHEMAEEETDAG